MEIPGNSLLNRRGPKSGGIRAPLFEKKMFSFFSGRVPVYVHPSFYSPPKVRYPMDVGGVSRDGRVTIELGTGSPMIFVPSSTLSR